MTENTDTRTATQRIEDLERVLSSLYQYVVNQMKPTVENLLTTQGDVGLMKDALKLLNRKLDVTIQVANEATGINQQTVSDLVVKMNVEDLKAQVAQYIANGHLVPTDSVVDGTYLVCEEYNAEGTLVNPRIQFRLESQDKPTVDALKGKKVGDQVTFEDANKFSAKVLEIYTIVEKSQEEAAPAAPTTTASEAAPAVAEAASAAEATSNVTMDSATEVAPASTETKTA